MTQPAIALNQRSRNLLPLLPILIPVPVFLWAYWTTLTDMAQQWSTDPQYSHGYLVPVFALVLLWLRRGLLPEQGLRPNVWGAVIFFAAIALRLAGTFYYFVWLDPISLLPCLAGLFLMIGGWLALRWAWPAILFLLFMIPLPYSVSVALTGPLQHVATLSSTFLLQTLGLSAVAEGNVILLNDTEINIVEACSGLRMLVVFFALSTALALLIRRSLWEKLLLVASALPIALVSNVIRITATGILHEMVGSEAARSFSHDLAGWLMMPVGLIFLGIELKLLQHLLITEAAPAGPIRLDGSAARQTTPSTPPPSRAQRRARAAKQRPPEAALQPVAKT